MSMQMIENFERNLANVPDLYVKCYFDKDDNLIDFDMHPVYEKIVDAMFKMDKYSLDVTLRLVSLMSLLAAKNGSDTKSCNTFFQAITCSLAEHHKIGKDVYFHRLAELGYFGTRQ